MRDDGHAIGPRDTKRDADWRQSEVLDAASRGVRDLCRLEMSEVARTIALQADQCRDLLAAGLGVSVAVAEPRRRGVPCALTGASSAVDAAAMEVVARQLILPKSYGTPNHLLRWEEVEQKLLGSKTYWLATTRRDGRPHSVPVDGIWREGALYFGGDAATVHMRNLRSNPRAVIHTESGESPVIAGGHRGVASAEPGRDPRPGRGNADKVWISGVPRLIECRYLAPKSRTGAGLERALPRRHPLHA